MFENIRAPVRPRVLTPGVAEPQVLEDEVRTQLEAGKCGLIELLGPPGAGKSTALGHLAAIFGESSQLVLADRPDETEFDSLLGCAQEALVIFASPASPLTPALICPWRLAPWGPDEFIEYLLARHRSQCASVMARLKADPNRRWPGGSPELWQQVLDRFARDESRTDVKQALRDEVDGRLPTPRSRVLARELCYLRLVPWVADTWHTTELAKTKGVGGKLFSLLRHSCIQTLLAAEHVAHWLRADEPPALLRDPMPEALVREAAGLIHDDKPVLEKLQKIMDRGNPASHAMAASLLHATNTGWMPAVASAAKLQGAYLSGACWPGIRLASLDVSNADLSDANLVEAWLEGVTAPQANLSGINLHGAFLAGFSAEGATLAGADLSCVRAPSANFRYAKLPGANLEGALLRLARFEGADLRGARLCRADLSCAWFAASQLDEADFSGADLSLARFYGAVMRVAEFAGARFVRCHLSKCDLEGMWLPGANFESATLDGSHLTGSRMPGANFEFASLCHAGLAEIEWEGANLRGADLRGSTFHLGSSRSGLVGSPIACEGSRTGFYTDEFTEQDFKSPEEIRKANLCGADLRGARIDGVDFYLVDLRNARYTANQAEHFRRCGAILESRV